MAAAKKKTARGRKQDRARMARPRLRSEVRVEEDWPVRKAVKKVGNARKRVEKRLGR